MALGSGQLRLESSNGSVTEEYRIHEGNVEVRSPAAVGGEHSRRAWWRLTPEQLSLHVERNTVVAKWLEHRLGWRRLLRACVGEEPSMWEFSRNRNHSLSEHEHDRS